MAKTTLVDGPATTGQKVASGTISAVISNNFAEATGLFTLSWSVFNSIKILKFLFNKNSFEHILKIIHKTFLKVELQLLREDL